MYLKRGKKKNSTRKEIGDHKRKRWWGPSEENSVERWLMYEETEKNPKAKKKKKCYFNAGGWRHTYTLTHIHSRFDVACFFRWSLLRWRVKQRFSSKKRRREEQEKRRVTKISWTYCFFFSFLFNPLPASNLHLLKMAPLYLCDVTRHTQRPRHALPEESPNYERKLHYITYLNSAANETSCMNRHRS